MTEAITSAHHDLRSYPWIVEFSEFRIPTEEDRQRAIESIGPHILDRILDIWLKIITPDARVLKPDGCSTKFVLFGKRSDQRKFASTFGSRKLTKVPPELRRV
jgi:hypothetical protein